MRVETVVKKKEESGGCQKSEGAIGQELASKRVQEPGERSDRWKRNRPSELPRENPS